MDRQFMKRWFLRLSIQEFMFLYFPILPIYPWITPDLPKYSPPKNGNPPSVFSNIDFNCMQFFSFLVVLFLLCFRSLIEVISETELFSEPYNIRVRPTKRTWFGQQKMVHLSPLSLNGYISIIWVIPHFKRTYGFFTLIPTFITHNS